MVKLFASDIHPKEVIVIDRFFLNYKNTAEFITGYSVIFVKYK